MKRIKVYLILLLFLGSSAVIAQASRSATTEKSQAVGSLDDPKLSQEDKALLLAAGEDNPAKIDEASLVDPKMESKELPTEDDYGPSNAKPAEGQDSDPRLNAEQAQKRKRETPVPVTNHVSGANQPAGEAGGVITDYRSMKGGSDQPAGIQPESITNYRDMQGSKSQPAGVTPNK